MTCPLQQNLLAVLPAALSANPNALPAQPVILSRLQDWFLSDFSLQLVPASFLSLWSLLFHESIFEHAVQFDCASCVAIVSSFVSYQ